MTTQQRFESKIDKHGPLICEVQNNQWPELIGTRCHLWTAFKLSKGYGRFRDDVQVVYAHRYAYTLYIDNIPDGIDVLHKCDNPSCVNPKHLWLGTIADNNADRDAKGRLIVFRGEHHWKAKLTRKQVRKIRSDWRTGKYNRNSLAKQYNLSWQHTDAIVRGKAWKCLK